jgi:TRAP transporter TAXI family solute receptor
METFGSNDDIKRVDGDPKAFGVVSDLAYWTALAGGEPFEKKHTDLRMVGVNYVGTYALVSMNPKIRTKEDLVGKKIAMGKKGSVISLCSEFILRDQWGILDTVDAQYIGWKEGRPAIKDGLVDAMLIIIGLSRDDAGKPIWVDHPSFAELIALKEVYFIGPTAAEVKKGMEAKGWPAVYMELPAKALGPNQPDSAGVITIMNAYMADVSMPDEVAYEVIKVQYDYYKELGTYAAHVKFITPDVLGFAPISSEDGFHPGALKFLKEKGVKLYIGGKAPPLK